MKKRLLFACLSLAVMVTAVVNLPGEDQPAPKSKRLTTVKPDEAALERTRETVQLLDNVYKQTIVLITEKYVLDEEDFPAGSAAVELFSRIGKGGSHQARLIDATGDPYEPENVAKDEFEKQGIKQLKAGKNYVEEVVEKDGKPILRALTPVPVVMEKCIMCHSHYADVKKGEPIGAISYEIPIK